MTRAASGRPFLTGLTACALATAIAAAASASWQGSPATDPAAPAPPGAPSAPPAIPEGPDPDPDPVTTPRKPPLAAPPAGATPGGKEDAAAKPAPPPPAKRLDVAPTPAGSLERLDAADREALDALIGWALPRPEGVTPFADGAPVFPGKVIVIQSFTSRSSMQPVRSTEQALAQQLKDPDVVIIALHTPEGAADAEKRSNASKMSAILAVDGSGSWCDALGVWKKPVNIVVDRAGTVRAAGLNRKGLVDAVRSALSDANPAKPSLKPLAPDASAAPADPKVDWPPYANSIEPRRARDLRGKSAPAMNVTQWLNGAPRLDGRLVVVDFFASWCGPCMSAVPHMNELATRYEQDLVVVGISDEQAGTLRTGLGRAGYPVSTFNYPIGVDPDARMKKGFGVTAIPHVAVVSADGVVRWQGHPSFLNAAAVDSLVAANRASGLRSGSQSKAKAATAPKRGWTTAG